MHNIYEIMDTILAQVEEAGGDVEALDGTTIETPEGEEVEIRVTKIPMEMLPQVCDEAVAMLVGEEDDCDGCMQFGCSAHPTNSN